MKDAIQPGNHIGDKSVNCLQSIQATNWQCYY